MKKVGWIALGTVIGAVGAAIVADVTLMSRTQAAVGHDCKCSTAVVNKPSVTTTDVKVPLEGTSASAVVQTLA